MIEKYEKIIESLQNQNESLERDLKRAKRSSSDKEVKLGDLENKVKELISYNEEMEDELNRDRDNLVSCFRGKDY